MPHAYTEDQLVEQPAIGLFAELGWAVVCAEEEMFGAPSPHPSPTGRGSEGEGRAALGRETRGEVVLVSRLRAALEQLNPALPPEAIDTAISGIGQVPPGGELAFFGKKPGQATGHGSGHETRQESGVICVTGLCSSVNTDEEPDIDADI